MHDVTEMGADMEFYVTTTLRVCHGSKFDFVAGDVDKQVKQAEILQNEKMLRMPSEHFHCDIQQMNWRAHTYLQFE